MDDEILGYCCICDEPVFETDDYTYDGCELCHAGCLEDKLNEE